MIKPFLGAVLALSFSFTAAAEDYCLAIRGNGELAPAHWGAMANVVERLGLPRAQAGGSSASISMFLLDAIASNRFVTAEKPQAKRARAALLIKSLEGFTEFLMSTTQFKEFKTLYGQMMTIRQTQSLEEILLMVASPDAVRANEALIRKNLATAMEVGILNKKTFDSIILSLHSILAANDPSTAELETARVRFQVTELLQAVSIVGAFDAATDANLFFRPGFVDFDVLAKQLGEIGQFYSARDLNKADESKWSDFFNSCQAVSVGKQWPEFAGTNGCRDRFNEIIALHFSRPHANFAEEIIGKSILSFPATAVISGKSVAEVNTAFVKYANEMNPQFGATFKLQNPADVSFGYWGSEAALKKIETNLKKDDPKSRRFKALGSASWSEALRLSPAEPGLSPLKPFAHGKEDFYSAGGWSDLHPVKVLKAAGCSSVVYLTRRGGESLFAQGVAKRLLSVDPLDLTGTDTSFGRKWDLLRTRPKADADRNWIANNNGDTSDMTSLWSGLYNMANPNSSIRKSLDEADAILCTDWNAFQIKNGPHEMISDSYLAPYFVRRNSNLKQSSRLSPRIDTSERHADGYPKFVGCF